MNNKIFKIVFKPESALLADFPLHSDTAFGQFCWEYRFSKAEKSLENLLKQFSKKPIFTLSSGFFETYSTIYLPNPNVIYSYQEQEEDKSERIRTYLKRKNLKKSKFISLTIFNKILNGQLEEVIEGFYKRDNTYGSPFVQERKTNVRIDRETGRSKEGQLFTTHPKFFKRGINIIFFLKVIQENTFKDKELLEIFIDSLESGYGKKKSSGMGVLKHLSTTEFTGFEEPNRGKGLVSLSNTIPAYEEELDINWDLFLKYGKLGEKYANSDNPFKKTLLLSKPGTVFRFKKPYEEKGYLGAMTQNIGFLKDKKIQQNGYAFTLKMN